MAELKGRREVFPLENILTIDASTWISGQDRGMVMEWDFVGVSFGGYFTDIMDPRVMLANKGNIPTKAVVITNYGCNLTACNDHSVAYHAYGTALVPKNK